MRIPVIPTIVVLIACAIMVWLGIWQLGRADEKAEMIARYEAMADLPVVELRGLRDAEQHLFRRVRAECKQVTKWEAVSGVNANGVGGWAHRYRCFAQSKQRRAPSDTALLELYAVIGWSSRPVEPDWEGGEVEGILTPFGDNFKLVVEKPQAGLEPLATPDPNDLPNNHLSYAVQWFLFALTALVIYILALRRRARSE